MSNKLIEYRSALHSNGEVFLFNFKEEFTAFGVTDAYVNQFLSVISREKMESGKSLVGFIPHLSIIQRQCRNAFQCFSVFQSYQGWVLLRPAIESILIMGKWLDDRNNFEVWKQQETDWKSYRKVYEGKNLQSNSLPSAELIQGLLKTINDNFMHANPSYYHRHSQISQIDQDNFFLTISYFDDQKDHVSHLYAFLHATLFMLKQLGQMLAALYKNKGPFHVDLERLQKAFHAKVIGILNDDPESRKVLLELGLWPNILLQPTR